MLFAPDAIKACKNPYASLESVARDGFQYYIGYDPAISANGDYTVMMVLEVDDNMNKQVVHMFRAKGLDFREHINHIMELCRRYKPEIVMIETNTFAKAFAMELKNISDFPVKEFTMSRKKKEEIILNLQMNIDNGKIVLPTQNIKSKSVTDAIVQELGAFGINAHGKIEGVGAHDDIVIALALANYATKTFSDTFLDIDSGSLFSSAPNTPSKGGGFYGINL
jgi:phage FluMu gp28-like protein